VPFLQSVGGVLLPSWFNSNDSFEPDLERLWVQDLVRRDSQEELFAFMQPAWLELLDAVSGGAAANPRPVQPKLANLLASEHLLEAWARVASRKPELLGQINSLMADGRLWDRLQALAPAAGRQKEILIDIVTPETRNAFFSYEKKGSDNGDQRLQSKRRQESQAVLAIAHLISNKPGATDAPLIAKLRGPQTVGELLGEDARWLWPEFTAGRGADEDTASGGRGGDARRFPAAIWGQNPAGPWYVLEALVRYRNGDRTAALLPLEGAILGSETERTLLSLYMARALGDVGLALELDSQLPSGADSRRVQVRLQLLCAGGERAKAVGLWKSFIASRQKDINSAELSELTQFADTNSLPQPTSVLDGSRPLHPDLMLSVVSADVGAFASYRTTDAAAFRYALATSWGQDEDALDAEQVRFWMRELWATASSGLPSRGMKKLGGLWPHAEAWLLQLHSDRRLEALNSLEAGGETLVKMLRRADQSEAGQILLARTLLSMGDASSALTLLDQWIRTNRGGGLAHGSGDRDGDSGDSNDSSSQRERTLVERMRLWIDAFGAGSTRADAAGRLSGMLRESYENGPVSMEAWALALDLSAPEAKAALLKSLDRSWFLGRVDADSMGALVQALAKHAPKSAPLWLRRWTPGDTLLRARQRASAYVVLGQPKEAAKVYGDARRRSLWPAADDLAAFNEWRRLDATQGPELWQLASRFWKGYPPMPLEVHLRAHPLDCFSAASALESPKGASEDEMLRVEQSLRPAISDGDPYTLLRIKAARHWLPISWRAAAHCAKANEDSWDGRVDVYLRSMGNLRAADVNGALADLARIYSHSGSGDRLRETLEILHGRRHPGLKALRAELEKAPAENILDYRMEGGRPVPILPKDLTWALLGKLVEGRRG
jgi:hypothetical protein